MGVSCVSPLLLQGLLPSCLPLVRGQTSRRRRFSGNCSRFLVSVAQKYVQFMVVVLSRGTSRKRCLPPIIASCVPPRVSGRKLLRPPVFFIRYAPPPWFDLCVFSTPSKIAPCVGNHFPSVMLSSCDVVGATRPRFRMSMRSFHETGCLQFRRRSALFR